MIAQSEVKRFAHEEFGKVRVLMRNKKPWFVGKDVCRVLQITTHDAWGAVKDDDKDLAVYIIAEDLPVVVLVVNMDGLVALARSSSRSHKEEVLDWLQRTATPQDASGVVLF